MKRKSIAALALLPIGLFASSGNASSETAAAESVVSYSNQNGNMNNSRHYDDQVQVRGQQHMEQEDQRYGFSVMGDYLYWVPYFSNMPYAQKNNLGFQTVPTDAGEYLPGNIVTQNIDMSGDSGFRLTAGYQSDWQTVGFTAAWTRFHSTNTNKTTNDGITGSYASNNGYSGAIQGWWNTDEMTAGPIDDDDIGDVVYQATGTFDLKFDQLDFVFSTMYKPKDWCVIEPGMGLRALLTTMQLRATQVSNKWGENKVAEAPFNTARQVMTQDFDSVGLVGNMHSKFELSEGFSVVSSFALAYTVGDMKETNKSTVVQPTIETENIDAAKYQSLRSSNTVFKPQFDVDLGLQYEWINDEKTFGLLLELAYEMHYLPNFMQFIRSDGNESLGVINDDFDGAANQRRDRAVTEWSDLMFQGLRARAGISF